MIMQDQSKRLSEPLHWGRREKTVIATVLACVVLIVLGLGAYALTSGAPARADCINVTFASTLGGASERACGSRARRVCASGAFHGIEQELREACRRAGFPYIGRG
jgi:hypothetical protein